MLLVYVRDVGGPRGQHDGDGHAQREERILEDLRAAAGRGLEGTMVREGPCKLRTAPWATDAFFQGSAPRAVG